MADILSAFARHLADRRSARTVTTYARVADAFAIFSGIDDYSARMPSRAEVEGFLGRPRLDGARRSAAGRNQELAALRALSAFGRRDLGWTASPADGIPFTREPARHPSVLAAFEVRRLFEAGARIDEPRRRALVLATVALLSQAALRVHELVGLDVGQVDVASATLLGVHGKGGTVHDLPLNPPTVALLRAWLAERSRLVSADEPALFVSARRTRLSMRSVQHMVAALGVAAGIAKRLSPHVLRHSAATLALTMGTDISTVGELLRHADLNVTRRYLHLVDARRREAVRRLGTTIPADVLPVCGGLEGAPDARPRPDAQSAQDSGTFPLDVQHRLDAAA